MPIYAYRCDACGFRKDVLQKMSDPALTTCPSCGVESFAKQLSAPAFQLKGTGWYVTDFRDNGKKQEGADAAKTIPAGEANGSADSGGAADGAGNGAAEKGTADKKSDSKADSAGAKGANGAGGSAAAPAPVAKPAPTAGSTSSPSTTGGGSSAG